MELAVRSGGVFRVIHPGRQGVQGPSGLDANAAGDLGDQRALHKGPHLYHLSQTDEVLGAAFIVGDLLDAPVDKTGPDRRSRCRRQVGPQSTTHLKDS